MSWRARMIEDYAYFPKPYPFGPGPPKNMPRIRSKPNKDAQVVPTKSSVSTLSANTTMSGFPLKVRHRLEGKPEPEPEPFEEITPSRHAHYTFTFGLSKEDEEQVRSQLPSRLEFLSTSGLRGQPSFSLGKRASNPSAMISERLKRIKQSFHNSDQLPRVYHPKPYFQDWGQAEVGGKQQEWERDESGVMLQSTQKIFNHSALHEDWDSYFEGLDEMDRKEEGNDVGHLSMAELNQARAAFQPPMPKPSRLQPKTYYEVGPGTSRLVSVVSLNKNRTISAAPSSLSKKSSRKVRLEPDVTMFTKSPSLNPSHADKIIQRQLQKEAAASPMTNEQYSNRKKQLLAAALQVYDRDLPTYEVMPDIRDEALEAEEQMKAVSRQNVMDLLYHALTNQSTSISMKSPSTSLHLSNAHFADRGKLTPISRPLDQFSGPVVSTILREMNEDRAIGTNFANREFVQAQVNTGRISRRTPQVRKPTKERIKALRALENYDLSKLRQRKYMTPKPVLTLLSVKNAGNVVSNYSRIGGTTVPGSSAQSPQRFQFRTDQEMNTNSSHPGRGSFTGLSNLQTRNEKYNHGKTPGITAVNKPKLFGSHKRYTH